MAIDEGARVALGAGGLHVPRIGWGLWRLSGDVSHAVALARAALNAGFSLFDTADVYGLGAAGFGAVEALLGEAFARDPALRGRIVLATKGGIEPGAPYNSRAAWLVRACEDSLARLRTDVIDLYQIHRPDLLAHPQEVAEALTRLREAGKIREAGVSNYTAAQTRALAAHLPFPLASVQPEFSALASGVLEDGVLDLAMERGLAVLAWSPLGQGRLAEPGADAQAGRVAAALDAIAGTVGVTRAAAAIAWVLAHPSRPVALVGTQSPVRMADLAQARGVSITRAQWYEVLVAARGTPMP